MNEVLWLIGEGLLLLISIGVSAFFSGSETALTSVGAVKASQIAGKEDVEIHPLGDWLRNPSKYLTTLLVGNNIANIAGALLAGDFFRRLLEFMELGTAVAWSSAVAFFVMTGLVLVFGEIIPKTYSRHHHKTLAIKVIGPLNFLFRLLKYPIRFLEKLANVIIRMFGGEPAEDLPFVTADDLKLIIEVGEKQGLLEEDERNMLHSIFELSETQVREIMLPRVDIRYVDIKDDLEAVLNTFEEYDFSRLPVIDGSSDNIVGILYMRDLIHHWRKEEVNGDLVRKLMRPCIYIPETKKLDDALEQFQREKIHMAIVVDEYGGTAGLVTIEDILEEIVGEIQDEFDDEDEQIHQVSQKTWIVDASVDIDDLAEELDLELSEDDKDFESLAGLLLESHGDILKPGESLEHDGVRYTILDADHKRIRKVRVEKHPTRRAKADEKERRTGKAGPEPATA